MFLRYVYEHLVWSFLILSTDSSNNFIDEFLDEASFKAHKFNSLYLAFQFYLAT